MAQVKPVMFKLGTGHAKNSLWSLLIIYYTTRKQSGKTIMFAEWYMNGFTHVYFLAVELIWFCSVGGLPRDSYGEGHFCFNFSNIWDSAKSFSRTSSTQPPHEVTKVLFLQHLWFFHMCCFLEALYTWSWSQQRVWEAQYCQFLWKTRTFGIFQACHRFPNTLKRALPKEMTERPSQVFEN